ncbi:AraC family transcriptional regulator [Pseudomonas typographi]|uniref:AraC family transcriptional regulator n=1 Tax=Pseudomonas typographi TaxID=2715964 RepID=UPI0016850FC6|nr:AraC family transcriptional regulator [Pseudomonas typographi]MBD1587298.1 AraC family transcriptional regulator [Pseudomonas typographi]
MVDKDTISLHLVHEALRQAVPAAHWPRWLQHAGIAADAARVPAAKYAQLWQALAARFDDEFFGMDPRRLRQGSLAFFCQGALTQPTVEAAMAHSCRFMSLMLERLAPRLERHGSVAALLIDEVGAPARPFACFTLWLLLHGALCWFAGQRVPVLAVQLRGPAPAYLDDYRTLFGDNLAFDQPRSRLLFAAQCLALPMRRSEQELAVFLDQAPGNLLVKYRDPGSLARQVRGLLRQCAPADWPGAEAVARQLGLSVATLRRRLAEQGESFQRLKDHERQALALSQLADAGLALETVAARLGFADSRSFYRAFRKWFGASPGHYRQLAQAGTGQTAQRL